MNTDVIYVQKDFDNGDEDEDYEGPAIVGSFDGLALAVRRRKNTERARAEIRSRPPGRGPGSRGDPGHPHPRIRSRFDSIR